MRGWTGRRCPTCNGDGEITELDGQPVTCPACGGYGDEWGELPDEPTIKEPEE